ncbi:copper homeostasis membrane protein CopD [Pseudomonas putida]|uniref:copper homeostasis membrane protein CopD n=1 Tax=Pseudomonas putida TaxID=303 RepID=UPI003D995D3F
MSELANIILRFALYMDLMLLFGVVFFGLNSLKGSERITGMVLPFRSLLMGTIVFGAVLSIAGMVLLASAMSGESDIAALRPHVEMMVRETDVGLAWTVRIIALVIAAIATMLNQRSPTISLFVAAMAGGIALASLVWSGHGAMDEGVWHFTADILHLLAGGAWLGALVAFAWMSRGDALHTEDHVRLLARAVTRFESVGAVIVIALAVTGVVNYLYIAGPKLDVVLLGSYGMLLFVKVALFAGMLVLAALNRFHLGPLLERSLRDGQYQVAANALRRSVVVELAAAVLIVGLVAWLGTLSPETTTADL